MITMLFSLLLMIGMCSSLDAQAGQESKQQTRSTYATIREFINDACCAGSLAGNEPVEASIEQEVRGMLRDMKFNHADTISIRKVGLAGVRMAGPKNAMAWSLAGADYLYLVEDWYKTLSYEQRKSVVAHEINHLKQHHIPIMITLLALIGCAAGLQKLNKINIGRLEVAMIGLVSILVSQVLEYCADRGALQDGVALQDSVEVLTELEDYETELEESLPQWKLLIWLRSHTSIFSTHPWPEDRIEYLKKYDAALKKGKPLPSAILFCIKALARQWKDSVIDLVRIVRG